MSKVLVVFIFVFFLFSAPSAFAQTIPYIGSIRVDQAKDVTITNLKPNTQYYWLESKDGAQVYQDCFTPTSSEHTRTLNTSGDYRKHGTGQYRLSITESLVGQCQVLPSPTIVSEGFTVVAASSVANPLDDNKKCSEQGIIVDPVQKPNPEPLPNDNYLLYFKITADPVFNFLKNQEVRLKLRVGVGSGDTKPILVTNKTFPFALEGAAKTSGPHTADLEIRDQATGNFRRICKEITYHIPTEAEKYACSIDLSNVKGGEAPPNSTLNFQFSGGKNTDYKLSITNSNLTLITTTDGSGRGIFLDVPLNGKHGDELTLRVARNPQNFPSCSGKIKLSINASPPEGLPTQPPPSPPPPGVKKICLPGDPNCALAGGKPCGTDKDPAIQTAIGCIHTSPVGFIKDSLKFIIGIAGGLAFLMMILGAFQMLSSAGNPETLAAGKDRLTSAIIGLLFVIFAVLLLRIIGVDILGLGEQFGFK